MGKRQDTSKDQLRDLFLPASSHLPKSPEPPDMNLCLNMTLHIETKQGQSERLSMSLAKGRAHSLLSLLSNPLFGRGCLHGLRSLLTTYVFAVGFCSLVP